MRSQMCAADVVFVEVVPVSSLGGPLAVVSLPRVFVIDQGTPEANRTLALLAIDSTANL